MVPATVVVLLAVAAVNFGLGLSAVPLFGDEAFSWYVADADGLAELLRRTRETEIAPPAYYLVLDAWSQAVPTSDAWLRVPSVLAGLATVAATGWVACLVGGRRAVAPALALAAVSPLVLQYAQQARAYMLAMLLVTLAVAAALRAEASAGHRARWLAGVAACGAGALLTHYTAVLVLAPLAVWLLRRSAVPRARRVAVIAVLVLAGAAVAPLAWLQLTRGPADHPSAALSAGAVVELAGWPFDGRHAGAHGVLEVLAAALVAGMLVRLVAARERLGNAGLLAACAVTPVVAVVVLSALGQQLTWTRYVAVAAPLAIAAMAVCLSTLRLSLAAVVAGIAVGLGAYGSVLSHLPSRGFYPATEAAVAALPSRIDPVVLTGDQTTDASLRFYLATTRPATPVVALADLPAAARDARRLQIISAPADRTLLDGNLAPFGLRTLGARRVERGIPLQVTVAGRR